MKTLALTTAFLTVSGLLVLSGPSGRAAVLIETDRPTFLSQVASGSYTEDFEGLTGGEQAGSLPFSSGGFSYTISTPEALWVNEANTTYSTWLSNIAEQDTITITFTGAPVTALGGHFFLTEIDEDAIAGTVSLELNLGTTTTADSNTQGAPSQPFVGFLSDTPISSLTLTAPGFGGRFLTLDNITVGAAVPEPAQTAAGVSAGLLVLIALRRLRRATRQ